MKKAYKSLVAVSMSLLLTVSLFSTVASAQSQGSTIDGSSTVNDVTINVTVPTNIDFALDPLQLKSISGSQVASADYFFINKTAAPVKVDLNFTAKMATGVSLVSDKTTLKPNDTTVTTKNLYFGALGATKATDGDLNFAYKLGTAGKADPEGVYDATAATLTPFSTAGTATMAFALDKATTTATASDAPMDTLAANDKGIATFQFFGVLNTYAAWTANDISVSGAYTLTALSATTYSDYTKNNNYITGGLNQLTATAAAPTYSGPGFIASGSTTTTTSLATTVTDSKASTTDISIPFYFNGLTITSLAVAGTAIPSAQYSISGNNLVLAKGTSTYAWNSSSTGIKAMVLTLSDGKTYTFNLNITA